MAASFASSGLRGGQGSDQAGSQGEGADSGAYSPFSNPFGERPPLRTSAGYAVRLSASDLPTPGSFTPMGQSGSCGTPLSPPSWAAQQQHARSPGNMTPQSPHGGSNILAGMGVCDESGTPIESMRRNWFVSDDGDGMGSSTKVVNNAVFEFQPGDQEPNSAASPDMGFAAAAARAGLTPTAESWLSHGQVRCGVQGWSGWHGCCHCGGLKCRLRLHAEQASREFSAQDTTFLDALPLPSRRPRRAR